MEHSAEHDVVNHVDGRASFQIGYHEATNTYRAEFDSTTRLASEVIVDTVARAMGADPLDLPPIYSVLDPDALDTLFDERIVRPAHVDGTVTFRYADCTVTVTSRGTIEVAPVEDGIQ